MANSKYTYVREFEQDSTLLNECWIVVRVDGRSFSSFSNSHNFRKPNEPRALGAINSAAVHVMAEFDDVILAYGHSDEYRKILSSVVSTFSSSYCYFWPQFFPDQTLKSVPSFDGRIILYPTFETVVDYFSWRHVDCHINNQYNTCFWALVLEGKTNDDAYKWLKGTTKVEKNEYLFTTHKLNYNNLPNIFKLELSNKFFRKGTTLVKCNTNRGEVERSLRDLVEEDKGDAVDLKIVEESKRVSLTIERDELKSLEEKVNEKGDKNNILVLHCDIVKDSFWSVVGPIVCEN